jgi:hypothetical protein
MEKKGKRKNLFVLLLRQKNINPAHNKALHRTTIPLRSIEKRLL